MEENKPDKEENGLLPCPFCGSRPEVNFVGRNGIEIKCPSCIIKYKQKTIHHDTDWLMGKMRETWNARYTQPLSSAESKEAILDEHGIRISPFSSPAEQQQFQEILAAMESYSAILRKERDYYKALAEAAEQLIISVEQYGEYSTKDYEKWNELKSQNQ